MKMKESPNASCASGEARCTHESGVTVMTPGGSASHLMLAMPSSTECSTPTHILYMIYSYVILYLILFYCNSILSFLILSLYYVLFYSIIFVNLYIISYHIILYYVVLYCIVIYYIILYVIYTSITLALLCRSSHRIPPPLAPQAAERAQGQLALAMKQRGCPASKLFWRARPARSILE